MLKNVIKSFAVLDFVIICDKVFYIYLFQNSTRFLCNAVLDCIMSIINNVIFWLNDLFHRSAVLGMNQTRTKAIKNQKLKPLHSI
jgi:hypothetical protein